MRYYYLLKNIGLIYYFYLNKFLYMNYAQINNSFGFSFNIYIRDIYNDNYFPSHFIIKILE